MDTFKKLIVIAGGGTGGHVYPALAIADGLVEAGFEKDSIVFYGSNRSLERELVPSAGYKLISFSGRGLNRKDYLRNIVNLFSIVFSCFKALMLMILKRPAVVIGVGGYASVPALMASTLLRIPRVVHEQNAYVGRTNQLAYKLGAKVLTTFSNTLPPNIQSIQVGLPIRKDFEKVMDLRTQFLGTNQDHYTVVVSGGSLGSVAINDAVIEMVEKHRSEIDFSIFHICGKNNYEHVSSQYDKIGKLEFVSLHSYRDDIATIYARSNCVVSRAGAGTCVELESLGLCSILIPLPNAPGDHQNLNTRDLVRAGAGKVVDQTLLDGNILYDEIRSALESKIDIKQNDYHLEARNRIVTYLTDSILKI